MSNKELEWFDIETRLRKVVMEMLEPTLQKLSNDREAVGKVKRKMTRAKKRLDYVESLLGLGSKKSGWMEDVEKKIQDSAVDFYTFKSSSSQQMKNFIDFTDTTQLNFSNIRSTIDGIQQRLLAKDIEISSLHESLNNNKNATMDYFGNLKEDLTKTYNEMMQAANSAGKIADESLRKCIQVSTRQREIETSIEKNLVLIKDLVHQINKVNQEKATILDLQTETSNLQKLLDQISLRSGLIEVSVTEIIRYFDTYLPIDIQVSISDNLYSYLDSRQLRKYWRFEDERRRFLQNKTTDFQNSCDLQALMKRSVEYGHRAEKRADDLRNEIIRGRGDLKQLNSPAPSSRGSSNFRNYDQKPQTQDSPIRRQISMIEEESDEEIALTRGGLNELKKSIGEIEKLKEKLMEIKEKEFKVREDMRAGDDQNKIYLDILHNSIEETERKRKDDRTLFDTEIATLKNELESSVSKNQAWDVTIKNMSDLSAALVEFDLISQALMSQDEEDKGSPNTTQASKDNFLQILPNITTPRRNNANTAENPSQNNSIQSLKINNLPSGVPVLKYRNKIYTRSELIEILGHIIHDAWDTASLKPPYNNENNHATTNYAPSTAIPRTRSKHFRMPSGSSRANDSFTSKRNSKKTFPHSFIL
ncbi:unnamed protein product [Blepharisma stoltei]|uniref:Uncharacterized protein n=1 Tax=Blepharisma stoltei TaxID=1481888 RepID=A0AAU9IGP5_9CILI|nr:unnamed protein product [Blepharisma stoltei]